MPPLPPHDENNPRPKPPFWRNPWLLGLLFGLVTVTSIRPCMRRVPQAPPVGPSVGSFSLVDQEGRPFGHENLKGHVWIGGQFNTRPAHKSAVIEALLKLQAEAKKEKKNTRLLGFSNDPGFDTPERIKAFGQATGFDFSRVTLLTGSTTDLSRLANGPLKPVDEFDPPPPSFDKKPPPKAKTKAKSAAGRQKMMQRPMRHKPLVIIDHTGHLRGHYATDRWGIDEAFHRSLHVAKAK